MVQGENPGRLCLYGRQVGLSLYPAMHSAGVLADLHRYLGVVAIKAEGQPHDPLVSSRLPPPVAQSQTPRESQSQALHEGGYTAEVATGETVVFRRPDGQVIEEAVATALDRPGQDTVVAANRRLGLAIDSETSVPGWGGERLDYSLAVDALLCLDGRMNDDWKQTS